MPKFHPSFLLLLTLLACGCQQASVPDDPRVVSEREKFLLPDEPEEIVGIEEARETLSAPGDVTLVGAIGGVDDPWCRGKAEFVISDPALLMADDHAHECSDNCAFCKKRKAKAQSGRALVRFVNESGQVVPIDARKLFGVAERQTVVVRGKAEVDSLGNLIVAANGLYIRR